MAINVNLGNTPTYTINSGNVPPDGNINLTLASSGTLIVDGVNANIASIAGISGVANTTVQAVHGSQVTVGSNLAGVAAASSFTYDIGANSGITLQVPALNVGLLTNTTINFNGTNGTGHFTLVPGAINLNLSTYPKVTGLSTGDKIEVAGATAATLSGNTLTFTYPGLLGLPTTASFTLSGIPAGASITFDPATHTITYACFLRGTRVATPRGEVAVEDLQPGDEVLTLGRGKARIKWIGRRVFDPKMLDRPRDALPIRVSRDAIAENVPHRDLWLSPDHALFLDDVLIPVKLLVNGTTIVQERVEEPFEYFHIELDHHDVILVEGAFAETYLDLGNRQMFGQPNVFQLFPADAQSDWRDYCYPPVYSGPVFDRVRDRLDRQAEALGHIALRALAS